MEGIAELLGVPAVSAVSLEADLRTGISLRPKGWGISAAELMGEMIAQVGARPIDEILAVDRAAEAKIAFAASKRR